MRMIKIEAAKFRFVQFRTAFTERASSRIKLPLQYPNGDATDAASRQDCRPGRHETVAELRWTATGWRQACDTLLAATHDPTRPKSGQRRA